MKKERLVKGCIAVLVAAGLLFSGFRMAEVDAAVGIQEPDEGCSITIQVQGNLEFGGTDLPDATVSGNSLADQAVTDLQSPAVPIEVNLYRTAEITTDTSGRYVYRAVGAFSGDADEKGQFQKALDGLDDETTAQEWRNFSKLAAQIAGILREDPENRDAVEVDLTQAGAVQADRSETLTGGTAVIGGLSTGLYLVAAGKTCDENYEREYSFTPYLISLPGNDYDPKVENSSDVWKYNITVGLKPQITRLLGNLEIRKTLSERSLTEGTEGATSVFHVVVTDEKSGVKQEIYNNMVAFRLREAGQEDTITIGKFPAGARATVTEVYAGAGYEAGGESVRDNIVIVSDKAVAEGGTVATASFTNKPDGTLTGGYGIVNHFAEGAKTTEDVRKESNAGVDNKTAYSEAETPGSGGNPEPGAGAGGGSGSGSETPDNNAGTDNETGTGAPTE